MKNNPYQDILHLSRPASPNRKKMSMLERGAQFAPFAALTGYDGAIKETARLVDRELYLDENQLANLNEKLLLIQDNLSMEPSITITYFEKDLFKEGGEYLTITGIIKKIDTIERTITFQNKKKISIDTIIQIDSELFNAYE